MASSPEILLQTENVRIRYVPGSGDGRVCVVTFSNWTARPRRDRPGFGERFLCDRGLSAVYVTSAGNDWWQYEEMERLGPLLCGIRQRYPRLVTYGSSMGAYGAILFAPDCQADAVIAASPQCSIDPARIAFDKVRSRDGARLRIIRDAFRPSRAIVYVIYDNLNVDAEHARRIAEVLPVELLVAPGSGHPAVERLARAGVLKQTVLGLVHGTADLAELRRTLRRARGVSASYWRHQAMRGRHAPRQIALLRRAQALDPTRLDAYAMEARLLTRQGDLRGAAEAYRRGFAAGGKAPARVKAWYAELLLQLGRVQLAAAWADEALAMEPDHPKFRQLAAACLDALRAAPERGLRE
jgi:tetratricopeptide (TPR) repeat protein